jgi:uncharacterized membrane protein YsdA (DUF1294 family)
MSAARRPKRNWFLAFTGASVLLALGLYLGRVSAPLYAWLVAANSVALVIWGLDKWQAGRGGSRVPEATLHWMAALGAAPASFVGMLLYRHKLRKWQFPLLHGLALAAWGASLLWLQRR